jgi:hypothetical protein
MDVIHTGRKRNETLAEKAKIALRIFELLSDVADYIKELKTTFRLEVESRSAIPDALLVQTGIVLKSCTRSFRQIDEEIGDAVRKGKSAQAIKFNHEFATTECKEVKTTLSNLFLDCLSVQHKTLSMALFMANL